MMLQDHLLGGSIMEMGDTIFMFLCTLLVFIMTPGIALFYGGMLRSKNMLSTTMHSYTAIALVSIQWVFLGYTLAFGKDVFGVIGGVDFIGLKDTGFETLNGTIPSGLFMLFQMMFAILSVAILSGSIAERMKFGPFIIFILLWTTLVYDPLAHMIWGGGFLSQLGILDFAGGNVVHISSGISGLIAAILLGKRSNAKNSTPNSLPLAILGAALIWVGWFGFNVGSALTFNSIAMNAFISTMVASAAGAVGWSFVEWTTKRKPTVLGAVSGAISGLVSITPACGFVEIFASLPIGFIGGIVCFYGVTAIKQKLGYDDTLDAFGLHGIGGIWGGMATGLFATTKVNEAGANGLFYGDPKHLLTECMGILFTMIFSVVITFLILKGIQTFTSLRVKPEQEMIGLDLSIHGEKAYERPIL